MVEENARRKGAIPFICYERGDKGEGSPPCIGMTYIMERRGGNGGAKGKDPCAGKREATEG